MNFWSKSGSAEKLWGANLPYSIRGASGPWFDPYTNSLLVPDGWGTPFSSIRLRRLDLATGQELASVRTGTGVRCIAFDAEEKTLVAATDSRLMLLDRFTLVPVREWREKVPRYSDYIVWRNDQVLLKNWGASSLARFDLNSSRVSRLTTGSCVGMLEAPDSDHVVVLCGKEGRISFYNAHTHKIDRYIQTPQFLNAKLARAGNQVLVALGNPHHLTDSTVEHFREAYIIRIYDLSNPGTYSEVRAGQPFIDFWTTDLGDEITLCSKSEIRTCKVVGNHLRCAKTYPISRGFEVSTAILERSVAIGVRHEENHSVLMAYRLG